MKIEWRKPTLLSGPHIAVVVTEKAYHAAMKHCGVKKHSRGSWMKTTTADATVHWLDSEAGELCCIVALPEPKRKVSRTSLLGLLAHESVHIWQQFEARIGEVNASAEFEAYSVQNIFINLLDAYDAGTSNRKAKRND